MNNNPAQAEAIRHGEGPMLVLAGPGSGKTFVITRRVRYLIEQLHIRPDNILVITFSKAAASEMRERFLKDSGSSYPGVTFGTFHAVFFHILQNEYNLSPTHILRESTAHELLRDILLEVQPELAEEPEMVEAIREEITRYKGSRKPGHAANATPIPSRKGAAPPEATPDGTPPSGDPPDVSSYEPRSCRRELFFPVLRSYLTRTRSRNLVDFEDMLSLTCELFSKRPDILAVWQSKYSYILIDEFQDINPMQYEVIRMLAGTRRNIFAVGDDDQSIYGFRGATPGIMLRFPEDFPGAKQVTLSINYRCSEEVLSAASALIACNPDRYEKHLTAARGPVCPVTFPVCDDTNSEFEAIGKQIKRFLSEGCAPEEVAVLVRTNSEIRGLLPVFEKLSIPFCCHVLPPSLFRNSYVAPVLSYMRIASGGRARSDWLSIVNKPVRYAERVAFAAREVNLTDVYTILHKRGKDYVVERLQKLEADLARISGMNPYAAIHYIRHIVGYNRYLTDTAAEPAEVMDLLDELMNLSKDFRTIPDFLAYAEQEDERRRKAAERAKTGHGVSVLTFHRSKGLEFRHVILCDCNELVTPHKKALLPEHIAEERRLFYVAMTRSFGTLTLYSVRKRLTHLMMPSRFLGEIRLPESLAVPGVRVVHVKYGSGTIVSRDRTHIRIRFDGAILARNLPFPLCREDGSLVLEDFA